MLRVDKKDIGLSAQLFNIGHFLHDAAYIDIFLSRAFIPQIMLFCFIFTEKYMVGGMKKLKLTECTCTFVWI